MAQVIKLRHGTTTQWSTSTRILQPGEFGIDTTLRKFKVGNGSSSWSALPFINVLPSELAELAQDAIDTALTAGTGITKTYNDVSNTITVEVDTAYMATKDYVDQAITGVNNQSGTTYALVSDIGNPNGIASLDSDSYVPDSEISPDIARIIQLTAHTDGTTNVHGIADTSALATKTYADNAASTAVSAILDSAPTTLNTLNELAAAINDDASFASTVTTAVGLKAPIADPTFTGTVSIPTLSITTTATGITKSMVGLGNVDNTTDANKPISTATQTALDLKAPLADPTFTGTVGGVTKAMVGLSDVDNVSTATIYSNQYVTVSGTTRVINSSTDKFNVLEFTSSSPITVTIPNDTQDSGWPVGSSVEVRQAGSGQITISKDAAVTYNAPDAQYKTRVQWSSLFLEKRAANTWLVTGDSTA